MKNKQKEHLHPMMMMMTIDEDDLNKIGILKKASLKIPESDSEK